MRERGKQENEEKVAPIESQMTSHMMRPYSKEDEQKREERGKSPKGNSMAQVQIVETQSRHDQKWRD